MQAFLEQHIQNLKQKNDHIELLTDELERLKQAQTEALIENAKDIESTPNDPVLEAERNALAVFDFPKAAELRDEYYLQRCAQYREQQTKQRQQMAEEAYIAGQRWQNAPNLNKALERYQEAVEFQPTHHEALLQLIRVACALGDINLALTNVQTLRKQIDPEQDQPWLHLALLEEGDILQALGKNQQAFENYQQALEHLQALAKDSPDNLDIQRELSVSFDRIGDLYQAKGDANAALKAFQDSLTIRQQLAQRDPNNTQWQRDLSVSFEKMGNLYQAKGDANAALKAFQDSLTIAQQLAQRDPANTEWQRDLSVSFDRIGDLYQAKDDANAALNNYQDSLTICELLAKIDPSKVQWQTDLVISYVKLSQVQPENAKKLLSDALEILKTLDKDNKLNAEQKEQWLPALQEVLDSLK